MTTIELKFEKLSPTSRGILNELVGNCQEWLVLSDEFGRTDLDLKELRVLKGQALLRKFKNDIEKTMKG